LTGTFVGTDAPDDSRKRVVGRFYLHTAEEVHRLRKFFSASMKRLRSLDRNEKTFWMGMLMMFIGLTWWASLFVALIVVGALMVGESVITSYLAAWINSRIE
jgi:hypothetical protein